MECVQAGPEAIASAINAYVTFKNKEILNNAVGVKHVYVLPSYINRLLFIHKRDSISSLLMAYSSSLKEQLRACDYYSRSEYERCLTLTQREAKAKWIQFFGNKKPPFTKASMLWFVGGTVERGESNSQCIIREFVEEAPGWKVIIDEEYVRIDDDVFLGGMCCPLPGAKIVYDIDAFDPCATHASFEGTAITVSDLSFTFVHIYGSLVRYVISRLKPILYNRMWHKTDSTVMNGIASKRDIDLGLHIACPYDENQDIAQGADLDLVTFISSAKDDLGRFNSSSDSDFCEFPLRNWGNPKTQDNRTETDEIAADEPIVVDTPVKSADLEEPLKDALITIAHSIKACREDMRDFQSYDTFATTVAARGLTQLRNIVLHTEPLPVSSDTDESIVKDLNGGLPITRALPTFHEPYFPPEQYSTAVMPLFSQSQGVDDIMPDLEVLDIEESSSSCECDKCVRRKRSSSSSDFQI
jgi:hypothetical protein